MLECKNPPGAKNPGKKMGASLDAPQPQQRNKPDFRIDSTSAGPMRKAEAIMKQAIRQDMEPDQTDAFYSGFFPGFPPAGHQFRPRARSDDHGDR
jgi:hypothetical protein